MLIGYARVSKTDGSQVLDVQRDALVAAGVDPRIIVEMTQLPPEMLLLSDASAVYALAELALIPGFILLMLR